MTDIAPRLEMFRNGLQAEQLAPEKYVKPDRTSSSKEPVEPKKRQ